MKKIAIFASGSGSNAQNIIEYFKDDDTIIIDSLFSNKKDAYALERAKNFGIPTFLIERQNFKTSDVIVDILKSRGVELIVLAGFLWLIPENLINNFTIINIHPALLPKYGGKGMFGMNVHNAVIENGDSESGITIHYVNARYDEGKTIFQAKCTVLPTDTPDDVANKVHQLEYQYFPKVIKQVLYPEK